MSTELAERSETKIVFPGVLDQVSLELRQDLTLDEWGACGESLNRVHQASLWWIGDWLNYGFQTYGEPCSQYLNVFPDYSESTLKVARWVASRIERLRRVNSLSWGHHRAVGKFDPEEQDLWLKLAVEHHWTEKDLVEKIRETKRGVDQTPADAKKFEYLMLPEDAEAVDEELKRLREIYKYEGPTAQGQLLGQMAARSRGLADFEKAHDPKLS